MSSVLILLLQEYVEAANIFKIKVQDKLSIYFLTGFERGIFMRNNSQQFEEYGCPESPIDSEELQALKLGLAPLKGLVELANVGKVNPVLIDIIDTLELFVESFDKFIGVFDE